MTYWRSVVGHSGYEVSSDGQVRSVERAVVHKDGRVRRFKGKLLSPGIASNGYPTVAIGKHNSRTVHSLVAEAFIGPCPEGMEVLHADDDRTNPRLENLSYGTRSRNLRDAYARGRRCRAA